MLSADAGDHGSWFSTHDVANRTADISVVAALAWAVRASGTGRLGRGPVAEARTGNATRVSMVESVPMPDPTSDVRRPSWRRFPCAAAETAAGRSARTPGERSLTAIAANTPAAVTVVCVDVPGCEGGAILSTAQGGTIIFFSMATSFSAAALGAEGVAADLTMLVGNGYVPGHAELAMELIRTEPGVRGMFQRRIDEHSAEQGSTHQDSARHDSNDRNGE